jgi:hypothetical protein
MNIDDLPIDDPSSQPTKTVPSGEMDTLAKELNDSLKKVENIPKYAIKHVVGGTRLTSSIPPFLQEPLLIMVIYVLLSFDGVRHFLVSYIPQIKSVNDSCVSFTGTMVYAIIFAMLFMTAKKLLL